MQQKGLCVERIYWKMSGIALFPALLLSGCAPQTSAPVSKIAECSLFRDPGFEVHGLRDKDSSIIAEWQETGIRVCGWKRPQAEEIPKVKPIEQACKSVKTETKYRVVTVPGKTQYIAVGACQIPMPDTIQPPLSPMQSISSRVKDRYDALRSKVRKIMDGANDVKFR